MQIAALRRCGRQLITPQQELRGELNVPAFTFILTICLEQIQIDLIKLKSQEKKKHTAFSPNWGNFYSHIHVGNISTTSCTRLVETGWVLKGGGGGFHHVHTTQIRREEYFSFSTEEWKDEDSAY